MVRTTILRKKQNQNKRTLDLEYPMPSSDLHEHQEYTYIHAGKILYTHNMAVHALNPNPQKEIRGSQHPGLHIETLSQKVGVVAPNLEAEASGIQRSLA